MAGDSQRQMIQEAMEAIAARRQDARDSFTTKRSGQSLPYQQPLSLPMF